MTKRAGLLAGAILAAAAACAAQVAFADPKVQPGQEKGLGLIGPAIPDELKKAQADPYAPPAEPACQTLPAEIAQLDALLGPDMNQPRDKTFQPAKWVGDAVRHAIPYRGYIRFLTGADRKDKALARAANAGWARRGFLKGLAAKLNCPGPAQIAQAATQAPEAQLPAAAAIRAAVPAVPPTRPEDPTAATIQAPVLIPAATGPEPGPAAATPAEAGAVNAVQASEPMGGR